jgi:hypothetical protein
VELQKSKKNLGGRPPKPEHEKATAKIICWVTVKEKDQLQVEYDKMKAGRCLAFATFLKQKLFEIKAVSAPKEKELLLTILINLQDRGRQLSGISDKITTKDEGNSNEVRQAILAQLGSIQEMLTKLSTWLYES